MTKQAKTYLYGAREVATGKLVSDITNPRRKYWDKRGKKRILIIEVPTKPEHYYEAVKDNAETRAAVFGR